MVNVMHRLWRALPLSFISLALLAGFWTVAVQAATYEVVMDNRYPMPPLTAREADVLLHKATEAPYSGTYLNNKKAGTYVCRQCGLPLYRSEDKFESGCGWPSFDAELPGAVTRVPDADGQRVEIRCANCGGHLGHVFEGEGFTAKNIRHCVNSLSMSFAPAGSPEEKTALQRAIQAGKTTKPAGSAPATAEATPCTATAIVAGGCFWGVEDAFRKLPGVCDAISGYTGGHTEDPDYEDVCTDTTGHAEAVKVIFDPARISYEQILRRFFEIHDPTQKNRQGPDVGTQYRSAVFYATEAEKAVAERLIATLRGLGYAVVTEVSPAGTFYPAEAYHQRFAERTGRGACHFSVPRFRQKADGSPVAE